MKTIKEALKYGENILKMSNIYSAHLDAEILLSFVLKITKEKLHTNYESQLIANHQLDKFKKLINKRKRHSPIAYLTGKKEFYGIEFLVNKNVLIPRPETEILVENIIEFCRGDASHRPKRASHRLAPTILEIGTGSGCIALTLAKHLSKAKILATDISNKALIVAKKNQRRLSARNVKFKKSDLLSEIKNPKYRKWGQKPDIIVANLPYLTADELKEPSIKYEPKTALYGGKEGLEIFEKLFQQIKQRRGTLQCAPTIFLEIDENQAKKIAELAKKYFKKSKIIVKKDLAGKDRILIINL